jgi:hypothetical protein
LGQEDAKTGEFEEDENMFIPFKEGFRRHYGQQRSIVRDIYLQYYNHEGKVEWQNKMSI